MASAITAVGRSSGLTGDELFQNARREVFIQVDRVFAVLMVVQWLAGILMALIISPRQWNGNTSQIHEHVWAAIFIGGAISILPVMLVVTRPGETITRYVNSIAQVLWSALLIHLTGGRIETHFHVFGSLAFISLYRDWKVLLPATAVVAIDHLLRGIFFPQSVYGVLVASPWRTFEHAGWVLFEDAILIPACVNAAREMRNIAEQTARLRQSEERTRSIIATALDAVVLMDQNSIIMDWNAQAEHVFGWSAMEAVGKPFHSLVLAERFRLQHVEEMSSFVRKGTSTILDQRLEWAAIRRNGDEIPVELSLCALRMDDQFVFSAFIRDISQRKKFVDEITRAKEQAEAASRSKSSFLANMSHEIRTPMSAILGYSDLMLDPSRSDAEKRTNIQVVQRNARHLLQLINDILDISKIEAGKMSTEKIECDLPKVIAEVASMMRPRATDKGLDFRIVCDGPIPRKIQSDPLRLKQILTNLVSNAVKFTMRGMITLRIAFETRESHALVRFDVADTGVGMTSEQMQRLFQPFVQADDSTTRKFGGTGLGLVISKRLAVLLGGDITIESTPMVGSIFRVSIAAGACEGAEMVANANEFVLDSAPSAPTGNGEVRLKGRILLAEDGPDNQILLSLYLREAGAEVTIADNGRIAVSMASAQPFDVILMDMQMPELDGYGATAELRRLNINVPVVALTAHAMAGDREKCILAGCTDYLSKPVDRGDLLRMVHRYLNPNAPQIAVAAGPAHKPRAIVSDHAVLTFVERLPLRVDSLAEMMDSGNVREIERLAHQLKGVGTSYGFPEITSLATTVERLASENSALEKIQEEMEELIGFIRGIDGYAQEKEKHATARAPH